MKVADYLAGFLYEQNVTHVFEVVGGMITHLIDSIHRDGKIRIISVHHEQAAAFAAEGFARITGVPGVAMATSGPGAVNLLTGIGSCYYDSVPAVFITGQVNRAEQKKDRLIRQLGFQETDIVSMAGPITKAAWSLSDPEQVPDLLRKAFQLALGGRPGPVLLDIPMDVQRADISAGPSNKVDKTQEAYNNQDEIEQIFGRLIGAKRPLILAGGGIHSARALDQFRLFVERADVPVVNSLMAVDVLPYTNRLRVGLIGTYGNRWANLAIAESDFLLVIGSRLDIRQTGNDVDAFKNGRTIYHVDCDPGEINNRIEGCVPVVSHLLPFLTKAVETASNRVFPDRSAWISEIDGLRKQWPDTEEQPCIKGINPNLFMHMLSASSPKAAAYTVDVGQHQMWAGQSLQLSTGQRMLTSGGMGAMGAALPLAVGTAFALEKPVVSIAGDGGFQINIQELQTIAHHGLPVKIVIINNQAYGMVRQFQQSYFNERYQSTVWGVSAPDFTAISRAYHIAAGSISEPDEIGPALDELWKDPASPFLLEVSIDLKANAYPKIAFGYPFTEMEPFLTEGSEQQS